MKLLLATGSMLVALSSSVSAQTINTTTAWDGSSSISAWNSDVTETIGQTIGPNVVVKTGIAVGERVIVEADVFADSHVSLSAAVKYRPADGVEWLESPRW